jgi:hypothetical protein
VARTQHKEFLKHLSNSLFVYINSNGIDNHIKAATILLLTRYTKLAHMGDNKASAVYAAKLQGIKLALQIANKDAKSRNKRDRLIIFTDNRAAIRTF